jgi:hypothetical protein
LVLLEPPTHEWAPLINTLWDEVVASSSIVDLASRLAEFKIDALPSLGAFFWTEDGMRSLVRGQISVIDLTTGKVVADGQGIQTWSEVGLAGVTHIRVDTPREGDVTLLELPLVVGAVRASSVELDASETATVNSPQGQPEQASVDHAGDGALRQAQGTSLRAESTTEPLPDVAAIHNAETELLPSPFDPSEATTGSQPTSPVTPHMTSDSVDDAPSEATPGMADSAILALLCPQGHASPPSSTSCRVCGSPVAAQAPQFVARPVLATLRASNGSSTALDRSVLIGRAPSIDGSRGEVPRLMTVPSPNHDISRTHLEVAPDDWQIVATDLNSTNGTVLMRPGAAERQQLVPGEPVPVPVGSVMELGDGVSVLIDFPQ